MRATNIKLTLGLIALGFGLTLLWRAPSTLEPDPEGGTYPNYPSAYMKTVHVRQFDEQGALEYTLHADALNYREAHYDKDNDRTEIERPILHLINQNEAPWIARSDTGLVEQKGQHITLTGSVKLEQLRRDGTFTRLTTEEMVIKPKLQYAENDKPVTIEENNSTTTATGMRIDLNTQIYELLTQVKSHYVPL